jgi:chemotaxis protein methyltransferase CheR
LLEREFGPQLHDWSVSILGTDLDLEFLERARAGVYAEWALRGLPEQLRKECFTQTADGWRLDRRFTRWTSFAQHNLAQDPLPPPELRGSGLDLILCRNVMIYFDEGTIAHVVSGLQRSLAPEGWLLVGHAEGNTDVFRSFKAHHVEGAVLFQNVRGAKAPLALSPTPLFPAAPLPSGPRNSAEAFSPIMQSQTWQPYQLDAAKPEPLPATVPSVPVAAVPDLLVQVRKLVDQGAWAEAKAQLLYLVKAEPLNPLAHYYQGLVFSQLGRPAEAEAALRRALFLEPNLPLAYYHLGLLLVARGASLEAQKAFRNTLRAVEHAAAETLLLGSDLTVARLREATLLQIEGVKP